MISPHLSSISVFLPAFNDEKTIGKLVGEALSLLPSLTNDYEVIVINDGSADATGAVLDETARIAPQHVRVIHHPRNQGYGAALRSGFNAATKDLIFYTDGDAQYDVKELKLLLPLMTNEVDVVNGYKIKRKDDHHRAVSGAFYNRLARLFFRIPIRDVDCDFRLIRRSALQRVSLNSRSGAICVELVHKLASTGCVFKQVPVHHYERPFGRSQFFTPRRIAHTLVQFFALWWQEVASNSFRTRKAPASDSVVERKPRNQRIV
jgi:glycosyltransferase involved in cell wall biosynthesis